MEHLIEPLRNLGLSDKEARVYLALLQLGPATPYKMSKRAHLKRPTAYVIAEELLEKGFVVVAPGEKHTYIARPPEVLFEEFEKRIARSRKSLPELKSLQGGIAEKPTVLYFEGVEGIRQALFHRVKETHDTEIVGFYADASFTSPSLLPVTLEYNEYRIAHNIKARGIIADTKELREMGFDKYFNLKDQTSSVINARIVSKDIYSSNASFEFYENFIKIVFFDTAIAVIIESPTVATAMRQIFEMLWSRIPEGEFSKSKFMR
jgi:DNA-binding MarR family transcriptional regulator